MDSTQEEPAPPSVSSAAYQRALDFWFSRVNYEQRSPRPSDLKLDEMRTLLRRMGDPHRRLRILHVAGSKGKGSTAAMLAAILRAAGYRTGLFTSPHLCRVEERIQVDGQSISAAELIALLEEIRAVVEGAGPPPSPQPSPPGGEGRVRGELAPTFFEVATCAGFLHFVRRRVDVAVVEVGLGGRFDSTNVCRPLVSLITSISFDHTRQLGNRLASIAREKAGIIKPGRPTVSGATGAEARAVIERTCRERGAPLRQLGVDFRYRYEPGRITPEGDRRPRVQVFTDRRTWPLVELGLLGDHQAANAAVALACIEDLQAAGWHLDDQAVATGLANVAWPARLEVVQRRPLVVLDCAHNVASAEALVEALEASFPRGGRRLLVFAASNDKDVPGMFQILGPHFHQAFLTRYGHNPRAVPPEELAALLARTSDLSCTLAPTAMAAWQAARDGAGPHDLICIAGSVFLAGELRPLLTAEQPPAA